MPTPDPAPTAAEIVKVAEITKLSTDDVTEMIAEGTDQDISDAKWALTLADITTWAEIVDEANDIKRVGNVEFFEDTIGMSRLAFRNKVRERYGVEPLASETGTEMGAVASLGWF